MHTVTIIAVIIAAMTFIPGNWSSPVYHKYGNHLNKPKPSPQLTSPEAQLLSTSMVESGLTIEHVHGKSPPGSSPRVKGNEEKCTHPL